VAWFRLENVASVERTVPALFRTCTAKVSNAVVVVVSAVSTCSQKVSVATVAFAGMVTCCITVSVCAEPKPSSHASQVPPCAGSLVELLITPVLTTHGEGAVDPFSNPGLPSSCVDVPPPVAVTVSATLAVCVTVPPVAVMVTVAVPVVAVALAVNVSVEVPLPGAAMDVGEKLAVTPAGNPDAESETEELKPPLTVVEIDELPEVPCTIETLVGDAASVKFGAVAALTVTTTVVV